MSRRVIAHVCVRGTKLTTHEFIHFLFSWRGTVTGTVQGWRELWKGGL